MLNARLRERVCVRKCIGVVAAVVAVAPYIRARARTLAPPQPCAAVVNESCQREREREGGGRGREKKREMAKERRGRKGRRIGGREREREGSIRPGQSVTMSLV